MTNKKNQKEVEIIYKNYGLDLKSRYINYKTKNECIDKDGYKYYLSLNDIQDQRVKTNRIVSKGNIYSNDNIQLFLQKHNSNSILLNSYQDEKSELMLKCSCGNIYKTNWNHINNLNNLNCQQCVEKLRHINKKKDIKLINELVLKHNFKLIKYQNVHDIELEDCDGYKYQTSIYSLDKNLQLTRFHKTNPYTKYNMKLYIETHNIPVSVNFDKISLSQFKVKSTLLSCSCIECNNEYYTTWNNLINKKKYRCGFCNKRESTLENIIKQYLKERKIKFVQQKTFIGCRYKRRLPFDFYLTEYNCVIEVQGRQHYYPNKYFNRTLEEQQKYDKIKKDYCFYNDIMFIEIPYYTINNDTYKNIINNILE